MLLPIGAAMLLLAALAGCGAQRANVPVPTPREAAHTLAGAPAPLAALHRQGGQLLGGGQQAFAARLAALRGRPVVVNAWASWCGPCVAEFPLFQRTSVGYGTRVAFLGIDVDDGAGDARAFLHKHWVSYPSYADPDRRIARSAGATTGVPTTVFYGRDGRVAYIHQGQYRDERQLRADIGRYALRS